jgi:hypothetical protein
MNKRLQRLHLVIGAANPFKLQNRRTICEHVLQKGDPLQERGSFSLNHFLSIPYPLHTANFLQCHNRT